MIKVMSDPITALVKQLGLTGYNNSRITPAMLPTTAPFSTELIKPILKKVGIVAGIALALIIVLLVVHYWVKPIFNFHPDSGGIIPVPFTGDAGATTVWNDKNDRADIVLSDKAIPLRGIAYDYAFTLDMLIVDPMVANDMYRPILLRSSAADAMPEPTRVDENSGKTLSQVLGNHNIGITMDTGKNNLIISTTTVRGTATAMDSITVQNVPIRKPFTLGVVVGSKYMEVYMNGKLIRSKTFNAVVGNYIGTVKCFKPALASFVKIRNFRIWGNAVSPAVMRSVAVPTLTDFGNISFTSTLTPTTCK
jgi:hypothetical protein